MEEKGLIITAIVLVVLLGLGMFVLVNNIKVDAPEVDLSGLATTDEVVAIVSQAVSNIVIPASTNTVVNNNNVNDTTDRQSADYSGEYILTKAEFEDESTEAMALELATESVESKDFKRAVYDALVLYGVDIDSYKDITEIKVLDVEVKNNLKVKFDVKVFYFIEDDESEEYKSRLDVFKVTIDDLDFDDDFEDAEVDESYLTGLTVEYSREA